MFQALMDRSRSPLDVKKIQTILGGKRGPAPGAGRKKGVAWEVAVERPVYDLTIFKLRCSLFTLKIYTKGECVLRVETIAHNVKKLRCGYRLEKFPEIVRRLQGILEKFMDVLGCIDQCFLGDATLEQLPAPLAGRQDEGGRDRFQPAAYTLGHGGSLGFGPIPWWLHGLSVGPSSPKPQPTKCIRIRPPRRRLRFKKTARKTNAGAD